MYTNPILPGVNPDPSICRAGPDYYLATSTFFFVPGVPIYHSRDLVHWRLVGHALTRRSQFRLDEDSEPHTEPTRPPEIYAPTLRYHKGTFYLITTNVHGGGNFFVTACDPAGPWSEPIFIDDGAFDPSLFFDDDGKVYYTRRGPFETKDIVQAEIDLETGKLFAPLRSISLGMVSDDAEGPHLYKINGWYYLMIAEGGSMSLHMETIGRSQSPWGPFEPCPWNPILSQHHAWWHLVHATGHADLVEAHDGSWWLVFLATRHTNYHDLTLIGRESFLAPLTWESGWPVVDAQAMRSLEVDAPTLPLHPWKPQPERDDFDSMTLARDWTFTAFPKPEHFDLWSRPGWLRLHGQAAQPGEGQPATFCGKRQLALYSEARTLLEFEPACEDEEAGLTVFMRTNYQYQLAITLHGGKRALLLRKRMGDICQETIVTHLPDGALVLQVRSNPETYEFAWGTLGAELQPGGSALTRFLATEVAQTWSGLLIGVYACRTTSARGNGSPYVASADFDWFEYKKLGVGSS
jgi:xylan 1,4-beta-xylosidase